MRIEDDIKLDFRDVLIRPKRSEAASRASVTVTKSYTFLNSRNTWTGTPIIAANMDTTGTFAMAKELSKHNCVAALHKHYSIEQLIEFFNRDANPASRSTFYTIGMKDSDLEKLAAVVNKVGHIDNICIDVANGYTQQFVDHCKSIRQKYQNSNIMVGNVCTPEMVSELILTGTADIIKIGVGPGSVCTTRIVAGVGYPQLSAIIECADAAHGLRGHVCADGGCSQPGDLAKAFGGGADFVMLGGMLSGHDECEGEWEYQTLPDGQKRKSSLLFYGMASKVAVEKYSGGLDNYRASEGRVVRVPYRGAISDNGGVIQQILGGLKSACAYVGASSLKDLPKCTTFVKCARTHNDVFLKNEV